MSAAEMADTGMLPCETSKMLAGKLPAAVEVLATPKPGATMHWPTYCCSSGLSSVVRPSGQRVHAFRLPLAE
jgi:hypothetical protein